MSFSSPRGNGVCFDALCMKNNVKSDSDQKKEMEKGRISVYISLFWDPFCLEVMKKKSKMFQLFKEGTQSVM